MKYTFFTDVHMFGPHEIPVIWDTGPNCYYLGDNIDIRCCKPKNLTTAKMMMDLFKSIFKDRFIRGNHELGQDDNDFIVVDQILMTHGDYLFWSKERADRYRAQNPCMNFFQYWYIKIVFGWLFQLFTWPVTKKVRERAVKLAKHFNCHTVICGHWHPRKLIDIKQDDVRFLILPRGKHTLDL